MIYFDSNAPDMANLLFHGEDIHSPFFAVSRVVTPME